MTEETAARVDDRPVLVSVEARVATVTLNRPRARNALSSELIHELRRSLRVLDQDVQRRRRRPDRIRPSLLRWPRP